MSLPIIAYAIVIILMSKYPIDRKDQHKMKAIIESIDASIANS